MKKSLTLLIGAMLATTMHSAPAAAGPFGSLKKTVKKVERVAEDVDDAVDTVDSVRRGQAPRIRGSRPYSPGSTSASPSTARAPDHAGTPAAVPAKFVGQLNCANIGLGNAFVARGGKYTFSEGIGTQERTGLLDRRNVSASNGCLMPGLGVGDVLYVEVDKAAYNGRGNYDLQCVSYDGSEQLNRSTRPPENNYSGKDVMLHTGNSAGYTPTASGSNSSRSGQYRDLLNSRGREMITFNMPSLHTDKRGTDFFCQHYNKATGQVSLAFTYRRGPAG